MTRQINVTITRTIDGEVLVGQVPESTVPAWTQNGWTVVDDEGSEADPVEGTEDHPEPEKQVKRSKTKEK